MATMQSLGIRNIFKRRSSTSKYAVAAFEFAALICFVVCAPAQTRDALWSGEVQCTLSVQLSGYSHQETQTWRLTGEPPRMSGSIAVYPAIWTVSSSGSGQRTVNNQFTASQWKSSAAPISAPIAMFLRVNGALVIKSFHSLLSAPKAITITRQVSLLGTTPALSTVQYAADEWLMPPIETVGTTSGISGSGTTAVGATGIPERPGGSTQTANCTWHFMKVGAPQTQHAAVVTTSTVIRPTVGTIGVSGSPGTVVSGSSAGAAAQSQTSPAGGASASLDTQTSSGASGSNTKFTSSSASAAGGGSAADAGTSVASGAAAISKTGSAGEASGGSAAGATSTSSGTTGPTSGTSSSTITSLPQQPVQLTIVPAISEVTPNSVLEGQSNLPVVITGSFTHFVDGLSSVKFAAPNLITVNSVKVSSPTTLTAYINVFHIGSTPFSGGKFDVTVDTPPPASASQQSISGASHEIVSLAGAFNVQPHALPFHNTMATFAPNSGQQGQSITVTITGTDTHFTQGVTQIPESPLSTSRISAPTLTVISPTTATATFTILPTAFTGTSTNTLAVTTNTAQSLETALGDFTITPMPDAFSHGPNPTSGVDISTATPQTFDGQLASLSGQDWFWLECDTAACTISLQNVSAPTNIVVDVLDTSLNVIASTVQQANSLTQSSGSTMKIVGNSAFYYLRVRATAWDLSQPKYRLVVTGTQQ